MAGVVRQNAPFRHERTRVLLETVANPPRDDDGDTSSSTQWDFVPVPGSLPDYPADWPRICEASYTDVRFRRHHVLYLNLESNQVRMRSPTFPRADSDWHGISQLALGLPYRDLREFSYAGIDAWLENQVDVYVACASTHPTLRPLHNLTFNIELHTYNQVKFSG